MLAADEEYFLAIENQRKGQDCLDRLRQLQTAQNDWDAKYK